MTFWERLKADWPINRPAYLYFIGIIGCALINIPLVYLVITISNLLIKFAILIPMSLLVILCDWFHNKLQKYEFKKTTQEEL